MRSRHVLIALILVILAFGVGRLSAAVGTLDSPDVPANTQSFTLEDIYNRLDTGAAGAQSTFTEPGAAPGAGTMYDLNDIMAQAPAIDNTNGATETNVLDGKTFWGLTGGQWGLQPGTMTDREGDNASTAQAESGGVNYFTAPDGYYDGDDRVSATDAEVRALDTDIISGNIKSGVTIFGVPGSLHGGCTCCSTCTLHESRWCDNGDGTVTDLTTCLVWLQKADWGGQKMWEDCGTGSYDDAHTQAGILKADDYTWLDDGSREGDWRLPTFRELDGLVNGTPNLRCPSGSCNLHGFTGIQSGVYWSSTTDGNNKSHALDVSLGSGTSYISAKTNTFWVWPVRGGQ